MECAEDTQPCAASPRLIVRLIEFQWILYYYCREFSIAPSRAVRLQQCIVERSNDRNEKRKRVIHLSENVAINSNGSHILIQSRKNGRLFTSSLMKYWIRSIKRVRSRGPIMEWAGADYRGSVRVIEVREARMWASTRYMTDRVIRRLAADRIW